MNLLLIVLLTGLAAFISFRIFLRKPTIQLVTTGTGESTTVKYDSVVPTYGNTTVEELLEMELVSFEEEWEKAKPVLLEEADTVLLLEAEKLISEVEAIASSKVDVYGKLQIAIPGFMLLFKTKYYEPVNEFIALTVNRETGVELSEKELTALWK
jgi:hypothetical protein